MDLMPRPVGKTDETRGGDALCGSLTGGGMAARAEDKLEEMDSFEMEDGEETVVVNDRESGRICRHHSLVQMRESERLTD